MPHRLVRFLLVAASLTLGAVPLLAAASTADVEALLSSGEIDRAVATAREVVAAAPDDPDAHMALAQALATRGRSVQQVVDAAIDVEELAAGDAKLPAPGPGNTSLQVVYDPALFEEALASVRRAIRLAPDRQDLRFSECYLLTDAGEIAKASQAIFRLTESLPRSPEVVANLASYGSERAKRGDHEGAVTLLGVVVAAYPDDARAQIELGSALAHTGRREESLEALDRAAETGGDDVRILRRRAFLCLVLQAFERARSTFDRSWESTRDDADLMGAAAAAFGVDPASASIRLEQLATADTEVARVAEPLLRAVPDDVAVRMESAASLLADGQSLLAVPVLKHVLASRPDHARANELLDEIYAGLGFPRP